MKALEGHVSYEESDNNFAERHLCDDVFLKSVPVIYHATSFSHFTNVTQQIMRGSKVESKRFL